MSRIGLKPIEIPAGVDVKVDGTTVTVKGPKGELTRNVHPNMAVAVEGNEVIVKRPNDEKENKSLHGLTRTLIHNMVLGVTEGFKKNLEVNGVGYRVQVQNNKLTMNLGFSHQVIMDAPEGITIECPQCQRHCHQRRRQAGRRSVCRAGSREETPGTLQGQGYQV